MSKNQGSPVIAHDDGKPITEQDLVTESYQKPLQTSPNTSTSHQNADFYIDVHAHTFPDFYADALREAGINTIDGWKNPTWSLETALEAMDKYRVKTEMLSMSSPGINFLGGSKCIQMGRRLNDFHAQIVKEHSPRFGLLAILPLPDIDASLGEIAYAFDDLDADGIGLLSNYNGIYLSDPKMEPILAELNRRKAVVFVHPTIPPGWENFTVGLPAPIMEYLFDSSRWVQSMVQNGIKAKYPDATFIVAHSGGTIPLTQQRVVKFLMQGKNEIFNTFAYELTGTTEPEQIRCLMATADPKLCMMGFDNPFMKPDWWGPLQKSLETYDFPPGVLRAIQNGNALRLFPKVEKRLREAREFN